MGNLTSACISVHQSRRIQAPTWDCRELAIAPGHQSWRVDLVEVVLKVLKIVDNIKFLASLQLIRMRSGVGHEDCDTGEREVQGNMHAPRELGRTGTENKCREIWKLTHCT